MYITFNPLVYLFQTKSNAEDSSKNSCSENDSPKANDSVKYNIVDCGPVDWVCTNITIEWGDDTKNVSAICESNEQVKKLLVIKLPSILHK